MKHKKKNNKFKQLNALSEEFFFTTWIILCVSVWCILVGLFCIQKLLPSSRIVQPVEIITTDQGQWVLPANWRLYFEIKK
jgi:hypothetical protein